MVRTKIEINVSTLGQRTKSMNMIIGSNTTSEDVLRKVLEKFHMRESPAKYQLLAVAKNDAGSQGRVLQHRDHPSHILQQSHQNPTQFVVGVAHTSPRHPSPLKPASKLIRVHHQLQQGVQSFTSLIVSPTMSAKEMLELAVSKATPSDPASGYCLVLVTPKGDIPIRSDEYPYFMTYSSSQIELRKKKGSISPSSLRSVIPSLSPPPLPVNGQPNLSNLQLLKGKLRLHGELIDALHELSAQSKGGDLPESTSVRSRELVLEQALVEQNQILDVMQELISNLESENKDYRESINSRSVLASKWEAKARQLEREVAVPRLLPPSPVSGDLQIAELKKQLEERNQTILSLQSRLIHESGSVESSLMAKLSSARTKLEVERVRCIELEEEISQIKDDLTRLKGEVAANHSHLIGKESEILHLKHEMKTRQNFELQQQDLVMKQRESLAMKDIQLSSLVRALNKEKKVADQLRRIHTNSNSHSLLPGVADSSNNTSLDTVYPKLQVSLFEQVSGRETCAVELTRITEETQLGFSFTKVQLPISSRAPCLIVKAVKENSLAAGWLRPGDELMEVNGILCRSVQQSRAIKILEEGVGLLKMVVARGSVSKPLSHSTPMGGRMRLVDETSNNDRTALWATTLSPTTATFKSFAVDSMPSGPEENETPEYVTVPELYAISVAKEGEGGSLVDDQTPAGNEEVAGERSSSLSKSVSSMNESESLMTFSSKDDASRRRLREEVMELRDQLDDSEHIRVNLESELGTTQERAGHLQEEYELTMAENRDLQEQISTYEGEMIEIRQHVSALQTALVTLEAHVTDEQQKLASVENHNRVISGELVEAKDAASLAIEAREKMKLEAEQAKDELEKREGREREMESQLQELKTDNARFVSDVARMGGEVSELRSTLGKSRSSSEETIAGLRQELKQLQAQLALTREISERSTLSSQEEYQHLTTQLKSAKSLLMEAEMKESQRIVEGRYLKQAADLTNSQLQKIEADYQKTREELSLFKQEAEKKTVEMESLTVGLKGAQMKLDAKQQMVVRLQGEVDNLRRASSKLRNENSKLKETVKRLEIDLKASYLEEERLEEKLEASVLEKDEMFQQLEKAYEESTELTVTMERLSSQVRQLEEQETSKTREKNAEENEIITCLKISEAKLQQELDISQKKAELTSEQMSKMRSEMKLLGSRCESAAKELADSKRESEQLSAAKESLHQQLVQFQETHAKLEEEVEKKGLMEDSIRSALAQTEEQATIERQHLEEAKHRISELNSELKAVKEEKKRSTDMVSSLEFLQSQDQTKLEQMKQSIDSKEREMRQLNEQVENVNSLLQKTKLELTNLTSVNVGLEQQLEMGRQDGAKEVKGLKEKVTAGEKKISRLNDELRAQEAKSEMLQSKVEHMGEMVEEMSQDKHVMGMAIEESEKEREDLQTRNKQLQNRATQLKLELDRLAVSTDSLSSETAGLRQQVRQNEKELDQATAQLNAAEMNLEIITRAFRESERVNSIHTEKLEDLEARYKDSQSNLENMNTTLEGKSMEVFLQEDELTKLKTALELRQSECKSLQESLIALQVSAEDLRRTIKDSEEGKNQLISDNAQLDDEKKMVQDSLEKLAKEKESILVQKSDEIEGYQNEIKCLQVAEKAHIEEAARLKIFNQEAEVSIGQLLSAQEEVKKSVSKLGNEKDAEIIELQAEVREMKSKLSTATTDLNFASESEGTLRGEVMKLEQMNGELQEEVEQEKNNNNELKDEIELLTTTRQEIGELNEKVTVLSETLRDKTKKLLELEGVCRGTESELKSLESENKDLLEKALELSDLKISMAEKSESMAAMSKKLEEEAASCTQLLEERDQLLSRVREFEVSNYANQKESESASPTEDAGVKDMDQLLLMVQEKEECMSRMKAYTDNLLLNVLMSAPALLEKL